MYRHLEYLQTFKHVWRHWRKLEALERGGGKIRRWRREETTIGARNRNVKQPKFLVRNISTKDNLKRKEEYTGNLL